DAWLVQFPEIPRGLGPSLAALRDDLALAAMLAFEKAPVASFRRYQLAPHTRLRHVDCAVKAQDRDRGIKLDHQGTVPVLLEKWPADDFWLATPTHLPEARFAVRDLEALPGALGRRLGAYLLRHEDSSFEGLTSPHRERVDVLEIDADPPSILPRAPRPRPKV